MSTYSHCEVIFRSDAYRCTVLVNYGLIFNFKWVDFQTAGGKLKKETFGALL